jgi:hypothetical protein
LGLRLSFRITIEKTTSATLRRYDGENYFSKYLSGRREHRPFQETRESGGGDLKTAIADGQRSDFDNRSDLRSHMDTQFKNFDHRFDKMRDLWRSELSAWSK